MHIPDGYLSPQTCAVGFVAAVPVWTIAVRRVQRVVKNRNVPTLAVLSAVSFLAMMFNVPIPDGTTAHAVGATIIAILLVCALTGSFIGSQIFAFATETYSHIANPF